MKTNVLIVGAGASGLMAARTLAAECSITVLEVRNECGGRIRSFTFPGLPDVLEAGPEFVHGKLPLSTSLFKEAGIEMLPVEGKMYRKKAGRWVEEDEMIEGWDQLMSKMKRQEDDMTVDNFLNKYYDEPKYAELRKQVTAYVSGFDVADPAIASIKELSKEWSHEGETFRIPQGYGTMISFLEKDCKDKGVSIINNEHVTTISWNEHAVSVGTRAGNKYVADKAIVTVPVELMKKNTIEFIPSLGNHAKAFTQIGYGTVVKILLQFHKKFWPADMGFLFSDEQIPTWWTLSPMRVPILTGWVGGLPAEKLSSLTDQQILETSLLSLSSIFDIPAEGIRSNLLSSAVFNWKKVPESLGAYSFPTINTAAARKVLSLPVGLTLYFAGEGLYKGFYPGTVEAALESGKHAAEQLLKASIVDK